jgi:hypothetical protein
MANEKTTAFEKDVIDFFLRPGAAAPSRPTSIKVCLLVTITDAEAGTVTEASYAGYAAQDVGYGASADNGGVERSSNAAIIDFPAIVGADVPVVGLGVKDNAGSFRLVKALATKTFSAGDIPRINAGALTHDEG